MKPKQFLINLLEDDIMKAESAVISINIDLEILNDKRKKLEGKDLDECDKKIADLKIALPNVLTQKELLEEKLKRANDYAGNKSVS